MPFSTVHADQDGNYRISRNGDLGSSNNGVQEMSEREGGKLSSLASLDLAIFRGLREDTVLPIAAEAVVDPPNSSALGGRFACSAG